MTPAAAKMPSTSRSARTLACAATLALVALIAHASPAVAAPDLIVESLTLDPTTCANGTAVEITATIHNQGDSAADPSVTRIRINQDPATVGPDDTKLCSSLPTESLAPGASTVVVCTPTITGRPEGTNYVWAIADVNKEIGQVDTTNDRTPAALEVTAVQASDLIIDSVAVTPANGPNGKPVTITVTIRNQGAANARASSTRVRINQNPATVVGTDTQLCATIATPTIAAGLTTQVTCKPTLTDRPTGINYIWAIADVSDTAGQSDRTNDRGNTAFTVDPPPAPDLAVHALAVSPTSGPNGKSISITATVANDGEVSAPLTQTRFLINQNADGVVDGDAVLCDDIDTIGLTPGMSVPVKCKPTLLERPVGTNFVWAVADATDVAQQRNHDNDKLAASFTVEPGPAPDLIVESLQAVPTSARKGTSVAITARIRNQGEAPAAASTAIVRINSDPAGVLDSASVVCDAVPTPSISSGSSSDIHCNWIVGDEAPGPHYLWATADTTNTAGQNDHSNDAKSAAFTVLVPDGPDLTITKLVVRPTSARNDESVVVKATVANVGTLASGASATTIRINQNPSSVSDSDTVLCSDIATPALAATASVKLRCVATLSNRPVGANWVWAIADTTATSGQVSTTNDRRSAPLTVAYAGCVDDPFSPPTLVWPVEQPRVVQDYASYGSVPLAGGRLGYHSGIDLLSQLPGAPDQTEVYAAADGQVVAVNRGCPSPADAVVNPPAGKCAGGWGNYVVIRHGAGIFSVYAHLGEVFARRGCVEQGQRIAIAGSSGSTTIPVHLHFDVLADLVEPVSRKAFGAEYYKKFHPYAGRQPESETGRVQIHLDARDFMMRSRVRITQAAVASRASVTGSTLAYLAEGQQYISYGELVPGYVCIDLPNATAPRDGPPYADDERYGWVSAVAVEVLESGLAPGSVRVDGYEVFTQQGVGSAAVVMHDQATVFSAEVSKAWGGQQFAPTGGVVTEQGNGKLWRPVAVPGTSQSGPGQPRQAWLPVDLLGPPLHN